MVPCIWYVSKIAHPWERAMIGNMGAALARGVGLSTHTDGGTTDSVSTESSPGGPTLERMRLILLGGRPVASLGRPAGGARKVRSRPHTSWRPIPSGGHLPHFSRNDGRPSSSHC